jgi:hypothetical protein
MFVLDIDIDDVNSIDTRKIDGKKEFTDKRETGSHQDGYLEPRVIVRADVITCEEHLRRTVCKIDLCSKACGWRKESYAVPYSDQ